MRGPLLVLCLLFSSIAVLAQGGDSLYLRHNARICDSCISTLYIEHMECTDCKDFYVDSGTVYISRQVLSGFRLRVESGTPIDKRGAVPHYLNTSDLYFEDPKSFAKLWRDHRDFHKRYKIVGKVTRLDRYSLRFELHSFRRLRED